VANQTESQSISDITYQSFQSLRSQSVQLVRTDVLLCWGRAICPVHSNHHKDIS